MISLIKWFIGFAKIIDGIVWVITFTLIKPQLELKLSKKYSKLKYNLSNK